MKLLHVSYWNQIWRPTNRIFVGTRSHIYDYVHSCYQISGAHSYSTINATTSFASVLDSLSLSAYTNTFMKNFRNHPMDSFYESSPFWISSTFTFISYTLGWFVRYYTRYSITTHLTTQLHNRLGKNDQKIQRSVAIAKLCILASTHKMQKKHSENSFSFDTEDTIYHWQFSNWSHMEWSIIIRWYIETTQCHTRNGGRSSNMIQMVGTFCLPIHHTRSCPWSRLTILPARHSILRWNLCKRWWKMKEPGSYPHLPRPTLRGIMENTNAISKMVVLVYQNYASLRS